MDADSFVAWDRVLSVRGATTARAPRPGCINPRGRCLGHKKSGGLEHRRANATPASRSPDEEGWRSNVVLEKVPSTVCLPCSCTPRADNHEALMFEFRPIRQDADSSSVVKLAIKAGVAICLCIVASEWLANAAQRGDLPRVALVWPESEPWRGVKARPSPPATGSVTVYRNIGVDGVTTSTIPRTYNKSPAVISPCGDESPLGVKDLQP
jgi:hypothetical protein